MHEVAGISGLFFRATDPSMLDQWYKDHLEIDLVLTDYEQQPWSQESGPTVFALFPKDTDYFGDSDQAWMINFRVDNLDGIVEQLRSSNIEVAVDPERHPNGRCACLDDPDGNPIEVWGPAEYVPSIVDIGTLAASLPHASSGLCITSTRSEKNGMRPQVFHAE